VELHPVVVAQSSHEAARRRGEATLVQPDEVDNIPVQRIGLSVRRQRDCPDWGCPFHVRQCNTLNSASCVSIRFA
jgi:hypothetical protein